MVATGFINSVMFGLMGMCKKHWQQKNQGLQPTIPQIMFCGATTGTAIYAPSQYCRWAFPFAVLPILPNPNSFQVR